MSGTITVAEFKAQAKQMRKRLANLGEKVGHSECLERLSREHGHKDWNTCVAALTAAESTDAASPHWVGINGTIVPDFDFIGASLSQIKAHVGAADLNLLVSSRNDREWIDILYHFGDFAIPQGTGGYQMRYLKQKLESSSWIELRHGKDRLVVLCYLSSDDPSKISEGARMTIGDTIADEYSRSPKAEVRAWAQSREPDTEVRVFGDSEHTLARFRDSTLLRLITENINSDTEEPDEEPEDHGEGLDTIIAPGKIWQCHRVYGEPVEFWGKGDDVTIESVNPEDRVISFLHHPSQRSGKMTTPELLGGFLPIEIASQLPKAKQHPL